jgi:hypothetical protein
VSVLFTRKHKKKPQRFHLGKACKSFPRRHPFTIFSPFVSLTLLCGLASEVSLYSYFHKPLRHG